MAKTPMMGFRATPERRAKLLALSQGEGVSVTEVINRLIDAAEVKSTRRVTSGLALVREGEDHPGRLPSV